jgi:Amt family ammonium transporter
MAMLVTHICASTCSFVWMIMERIHKKQFTLVGAVSGAVTGLVVITPAAGFVDQTGAFAIGLVGALCCYPAVVIKNKLGLDQKALKDNYPDAFGIHAIGGMFGTFWTGLFANPSINLEAKGAFYFNDNFLGWQIVGIIFVVLWSAVCTSIIMLALKFTIGIDVSDEVEKEMILEIPKEAANIVYYVTPPPVVPVMHVPRPPVMMQPYTISYPYNPMMGSARMMSAPIMGAPMTHPMYSSGAF